MKQIKNILVTGSAGFIGYHTSLNLHPNFKIYTLDNLNNYYDQTLKNNRKKNLLKNNIHFEKIDLTNLKKLKNFFKKKRIDCVIHLAAQPGVRYSIEQPDTYLNNNIVATFNLLEVIKNLNIKHFIFASTSSLYGVKKERIFSEKLNTDSPMSFYASTKKATESILFNYSYIYKIPVTVVRLFTVYGPYGRPDMALYKFLYAAQNNKIIELYNNGNMWRDFTYIDDVVNSISRLINIIPKTKKILKFDNLSNHAPFRIVNIGNQKSIKVIEFIKILKKLTNLEFKILNKPMQIGDVPYTLSDSRLLKSLTGFEPITSLEEGIINFCKWYETYYKIKILKN